MRFRDIRQPLELIARARDRQALGEIVMRDELGLAGDASTGASVRFTSR